MKRQRKPFNYREFVTRWRWLCQMYGMDHRTGYQIETAVIDHKDDRGWHWLERIPALADPEPDVLCDELRETWWQTPLIWAEIGDNHSVVEAEAFANIAAEVRRIAGVPEPETVTDAVRAIWQEDGERRERQIAMPLREMYAARGETVDLVAGLRMIVPIKAA